MRRLFSTLSGLAVVGVLFAIGFSGSSVAPISEAPRAQAAAPLHQGSQAVAGGSWFWAPAEVVPSLSETATMAPAAAGCRPLSPLVAECPHRTPGESVGVLAGAERWRSTVAEYFRPEDVDLAMAIMMCESGGDPDAANPVSSARGLFQHLGSAWPERAADAGWGGADILDPESNIAVAAWLVYEGGGWGHWNASGHCW